MDLVAQASQVSEIAKEYVASAGVVLSKARSLVGGDAQFFATVPKTDELRYGLSAESVFEKRDTMKRIVAQMCKGNDMKHLFPDVVKNIHVPAIELRKLIYLFVVYYAEDCPNEALLSISAFQKDLVNSSMHVRSLALRMISSLRIPAIQPVVMVAVKKCSQDVAPIVRKTAAIALIQLHAVAQDEMDWLVVRGILQELLGDKNADVTAAAAMAYTRVCPRKVELLHPVFTHLCGVVGQCEEVGQVAILHVLLRYARLNFCDPSKPREDKKDAQEDGHDDHAGDETSSSTSSSSSEEVFAASAPNAGPEDNGDLDPDLALLLRSVRPLLRSVNSAVVIAAAAIYYHCAPPNYIDFCVKPLMRLLACSTPETHGIILDCVYNFLTLRPLPFQPYVKSFFLTPGDSSHVRQMKFRILAKLVTPATTQCVYSELKAYTRSVDDAVVVDAVSGLGLLVTQHAYFSSCAVDLLTTLFTHQSSKIVSEAVAVLRLLVVQQGSDVNSHTAKLVFRLMEQVMKGDIQVPSAVGTILWLVGENVHTNTAIAGAAPDCFRVFAQKFATLDMLVKRDVLLLGCKVWLHVDGTSDVADRFKQMFLFILELARYDDDYLIRDQGRLLENVVDRESPSFALLKSAILNTKPAPIMLDLHADHSQFELGSLSHLLGTAVFSYEELPSWQAAATDTALRHPLQHDLEQKAMSDSSSNTASSSENKFYTDSAGSNGTDDDTSATEYEEEKSTTAASSEDDDDTASTTSESSDEGGKHDKKHVKKPPPKPQVKIVVRSTTTMRSPVGHKKGEQPAPMAAAGESAASNANADDSITSDNKADETPQPDGTAGYQNHLDDKMDNLDSNALDDNFLHTDRTDDANDEGNTVEDN